MDNRAVPSHGILYDIYCVKLLNGSSTVLLGYFAAVCGPSLWQAWRRWRARAAGAAGGGWFLLGRWAEVADDFCGSRFAFMHVEGIHRAVPVCTRVREL